ncbi:MAG: YfcC family protein [Bacillota bacterium]|nr:YfcC family protein [Bacillota bacterium]
MSKFKVPTAYTILLIIIILVAGLTWLIPAGEYDRLEDGGPIPGTYHLTEANEQGAGDVLLASFEGFYDAVDIALFILVVGGFLGVVMKTGAINAGIVNVIQKLNGREKRLIPILMILFGLGGTTFGMWEETIAFFPLLIPIFIAAGYDSLVAVAVILLGAGMGTLASTVNPFATGIASGFAGISMGDGILVRLGMLVILEAIAIWFVMGYAARIKKDPSRSWVADHMEEHREHFLALNSDQEISQDTVLTRSQKWTLTLFGLTFLVMIYAVIPFDELGVPLLPALGWWFPELSALFFTSAVIIGLFARLKEEELTDGFVNGAADLLGVAFIIAISRGITVIMNNGLITDTILHWGENFLTGAGALSFSFFTYLIYLVLSIFIPSSSGLATLSIPIMAPLGDFAGVGRDVVITAFQAASGLVNLITPTSAVIMGALTLGRISYDRWFKFSWKFLVAIFVLSAAVIVASAMIS